MEYFDLGPFSRPITTQSPDAQVWFDRGLNWVYGYNPTASFNPLSCHSCARGCYH
jgi:hypothetical protein